MRPASQHFLSRLLRSCGIVVVLALIALGSSESAEATCGRAPVAPLAPSDAPTVPIELDRAALLSSLLPVDATTAGAWLVIDEPLSIPAVSGPPERPPRVA